MFHSLTNLASCCIFWYHLGVHVFGISVLAFINLHWPQDCSLGRWANMAIGPWANMANLGLVQVQTQSVCY